ncbi:hypothetical protein Tco_1265343 [Tanacetum coccineum]
MKVCNRGNEIYGMDEEGILKFWYCYLDGDRKSIKADGLSFPKFLLVRFSQQGNGIRCLLDSFSCGKKGFFVGVTTLVMPKNTSIGERDTGFQRGNQAMKLRKASYGATTPQELRRNQD